MLYIFYVIFEDEKRDNNISQEREYKLSKMQFVTTSKC